MNQNYFAVDGPSENRLNVIVIASACDDHRFVTNPRHLSAFHRLIGDFYFHVQLQCYTRRYTLSARARV
uniref:Uncharacterized protein n=1 Tax=Parascaris equorum TaxID=6256 RepID=A0A914S470_PAREQ